MLLEERPEWRVVNIDACTNAADLSIIQEELKNPNYAFYKLDIRDKNAVLDVFEKEHPSIVVHFAEDSNDGSTKQGLDSLLETNVTGVETLMNACLKNGVERFHLVNTDLVYGHLPLNGVNQLFREDSELRTCGPYSTSKVTEDYLVSTFGKAKGLSVTISRSSKNYGPHQSRDQFVPSIIIKALNDEPITLNKNGLNFEKWLYVKDHCRGILAILEKGKPGEIYNLGGESELNDLDIVKAILKYLGKPELLTVLVDEKVQAQRHAVDSTKAFKDLGWKPKTTLEVGLAQTIEWYKINR